MPKKDGSIVDSSLPSWLVNPDDPYGEKALQRARQISDRLLGWIPWGKKQTKGPEESQQEESHQQNP